MSEWKQLSRGRKTKHKVIDNWIAKIYVPGSYPKDKCGWTLRHFCHENKKVMDRYREYEFQSIANFILPKLTVNCGSFMKDSTHCKRCNEEVPKSILLWLELNKV